ncbi:hypothetical protein LSUE1_G001867 [Lachnellula suecica]|uniref:Mannan endo-1,6-alpha-mannosidase n=1 Tax=Lachnellula suecica TaxID=602035 RepID=A0A8T9C6U5_9HELO|nr:hypothetical protein LSUE1_G001867 [Lachnellula suecica]
MGQSFSTTTKQWANISGWEAANVYNDIIDNDRYSGDNTWQSSYGAALSAIASTPSLQNGRAQTEDMYTDDRLWWCLAMLRTYDTYDRGNMKNTALLAAINSYDTIAKQSLLSSKDSGTMPSGRSIQIKAGCDVDGAVYWTSQATSPVTSISTSLFAEVSAWLFDITSNSTYHDNAVKSLGWIQRVALDAKTGTVGKDSMRPANCQILPGGLTYNTGVYLGTLSSLYLTTGNTSYLDAANLTASHTALGHWTSKSTTPKLVVDEEIGVTKAGDQVQWRDVLFRNLVDYYILVSEKNINPTVRTQIKAFWQANYDQIQKFAKPNPNVDLYTAEWFGAVKTGSDWGTGSVVSVLNGAMVILG